MKKTLALLLLTACSPLALAAEAFTSPLPELPPNREVAVVEIAVPPGGGTGSPVHRHDAYVYVYVIEGTLELQLEGGDVHRVEAGQIFTEAPDDVHVLTRNVSDTEPARFVAFMIKEAGAPLSKPVE